MARDRGRKGRRDDEEIRAWVARLGAGRRTRDLLGEDPGDDVEIPSVARGGLFRSRRELAEAIAEVVDAGWSPGHDGV